MRLNRTILKYIENLVLSLVMLTIAVTFSLGAHAQNYKEPIPVSEFKKISAIPETKRTTDNWSALFAYHLDSKQYAKAEELLKRWQQNAAGNRAALLWIADDRGLILLAQDRPLDARNLVYDALMQFGTPQNLEEKQAFSSAMLNLGGYLKHTSMRDYDTAGKVFLVVLQLGSDPSKDDFLVLNALRAGYNAGLMNLEMRPPRYADAVYIYDSILQNFKFAADTEAQNILAWSMVNKAYALHRSNPSDPSMALIVYYQLLSDYGKNPNPAIQETIALAAHNAGAMCAGHVPALSDKAIWFFDFVINNYQSSKNERVKFYIADSLFLKAVVFDQQVRDHREAKKLYSTFVKTYGNSKNIDLAEKINRAKLRLRELS